MRFRYSGLDASGQKVTGEMVAGDQTEAQRELERSGLSQVDVASVAAGPLAWLRARARRGVGQRRLLDFSEQFETLLGAGLPLDRALHVVLNTMEHAETRAIIEGVIVGVEKGESLSTAFSRYPAMFPRLYVSMIRAAEEGGLLPVVLKRLVSYYEQSLEFRSFLIASSVYPAVLLVFSTVAILVLSIFVIPRFAEIFVGINQPIPLAAQLLLTGAGLLERWWGALAAIVIALVVGARFYFATPAGRDAWQRRVFIIPLIGSLLFRAQLARICRTMGTLLASGVPILTSMRAVHGLSDNILLQQALDRLQRGVKEGKGLARPLLADPLFPRMMGQLVAIGEESGALDGMLIKIADRYEAEVRRATRTLLTVLEPALIIAMGGSIGVIVVSMLYAIFSINEIPL
jgi:type II secretory pathway component PulF